MKYLRRGMVRIAVKLLIVTVCVSLLVCVFYMAYNIGNAYVLITEGLRKRVEVCLTRENYTELNSYFSVSFLNQDPVLAVSLTEDSPYYSYNITSFDYDVKLQKLRAWPWEDTITCTVTEFVDDINGTVKAAYATTASGKIAPWQSSRCTVTLHRQSDGVWKISGLIQDTGYKDTES